MRSVQEEGRKPLSTQLEVDVDGWTEAVGVLKKKMREYFHLLNTK
jgi:hypothetical protein